MAGRFLITTADERSWKADRPLIFLGEWCRRFDRECVWSWLDAIVARPVSFDGAERDRVIEHIELLSRELLLELAEFLNGFHRIRKSLRFWRILLGHWVHRYTCAMFHRWHAIRRVLEDHEISGTILLTDRSLQLARHDTEAFIWACNDDLWNNVLMGRILQRTSQVPVEYKSIDAVNSVTGQGSRTAMDAGIGPRRLFGSIAAEAFDVLQRDSDALIISSYLPPIRAAMLSLLLRQVPRRRRTAPVRPVAADANLRATSRLDSGPRKEFAGFARDMLVELLPTCFLEGFGSLLSQVEEARWPRRPRFIFTSGSFDTNEVFKLWAADRVEEGRPYIIGQHGNNYGTARYCPSETECVETGDAFITWGWQDASRRCKPAFVFRTAGRSRGVWKPHGRVLLIEDCLPHLTLPWDPYPEFSAYYQNQFEFVESLPEAVRRATIVRLHAACRRQSWSDRERWRQRLPQISLDDGSTPIATLMSASRVIVHSYDSTGILETLSLNLPTVCFWRGGLAHLRDSAVPFYELLKSAGILHETPQRAARQVADVWHDIGAWWGSQAVQDSRKKFIEQYAKTSAQPVRSLKRLLLDSSSVAGRC